MALLVFLALAAAAVAAAVFLAQPEGDGDGIDPSATSYSIPGYDLSLIHISAPSAIASPGSRRATDSSRM